MLAEPECYRRQCKHFVGVIQPDGTEMTETNMCGAFPKGIPYEIAYGDNKHEKVMKGQDKLYIYEKDTNWENHWDNLLEEDVALWRKVNTDGVE